MLHVFGHKNPDSDSICTALVAADWLNRQGRAAQAYALGEPIAETRFILETAGVAAPPLLQGSVANKEVFLVDFSELEQGPEGLAEADVQGPHRSPSHWYPHHPGPARCLDPGRRVQRHRAAGADGL